MSSWPTLTYRRPKLGRDYWVQDDFLPNVDEVSRRCYDRDDWELGAPHTKQVWPGRRAAQALAPDELKGVDAWVSKVTNARRLWVEPPTEGRANYHNYAQLVGMNESGPRPHTDLRRECRYAAVIYLTPKPDPKAGTSFYRLRCPDGTLGGNLCGPQHADLSEALGVSSLPFAAWVEDMRVDNRFNRIVLYRGDLVHSASAYFGLDYSDKRMTATFFWMA
ncbi:MAG TPA: hypothetical protein DGZ24_07900 [Rhodospirillaceae bacterium]|nr:hypothetical protein [Candidatus Neomarinimicrobiota bacterium]HCX15224.1 hypothetical protein [Rhodospirillaceae bacterium]